MPVRGRILIVGGHSRVGHALALLLGPAATRACRRPVKASDGFRVEDYGDIPQAAFDGISCVVNCAGISRGGTALLEHVNVDMPRRLALAARAAGGRHMIHISSLAVYGGARLIDRHTPTAPATAYGRSKLAADGALLSVADERFTVTVLRLPMIYGGTSLGKLGRLLRFWKRARVLPVPAGDIARAMVGVELVAEVIARLAAAPATGIVFAADPAPFTYSAAARARPEPMHRLPIPQALTGVVERLFPEVGARLFADCRLVEEDNLAVRFGLASRLYGDISAACLV